MDIFSQFEDWANFGIVIKAHGKQWVGIKRYQREDLVYWLAVDIDGNLPSVVHLVMEDSKNNSSS